MPAEEDRFVPKVHPLSRPAEPEDPYSLHAMAVAGDTELMLRSVVQEYAWMGYGSEQIVNLFRDPFYPVLYGLWCALGEEAIRSRIAEILGSSGVLRFAEILNEAPAEPEPDVIQIGIAARPSSPAPPAPAADPALDPQRDQS